MAQKEPSQAESAQQSAALKAAQLREQAAQQASRNGDKTAASESFRKAAANYLNAGYLKETVRCLAGCDDLTRSLPVLLRTFKPAAIVAAAREHLEHSPLDFGLCLLAAASATKDYRQYSATYVLAKSAGSLSPQDAARALMGSVIAAGWQNDGESLKRLCPLLRKALHRAGEQAPDVATKKRVLLREICVIGGEVSLAGDLMLLPEIDKLQMAYLSLGGDVLRDDHFLRTLFPMFIARDVDMADLLRIARERPGLTTVAAAYEGLQNVAARSDLSAALSAFTSSLAGLKRPAPDNITTWADVEARFLEIQTFQPEHLAAAILRGQYREYVGDLKVLLPQLSACAEKFSAKNYAKAMTQLESCMAVPTFSELPEEYRAGIVTLAARCAFELDRWEALDRLTEEMESKFGIESPLAVVLED